VHVAAIRLARPTNDLSRIRRFYENAVGFRVLRVFNDHDGFDGVVFGCPEEQWQLELVRAPQGITPRPTVEDALVLYSRDPTGLAQVAERLRAAGTVEVPPDDADLNPYWPRNGALTFVDPDGYRLILSPG
jgi:catechol 2,3-dioxygenase-like lactoylglutathione lyase family enzyme